MNAVTHKNTVTTVTPVTSSRGAACRRNRNFLRRLQRLQMVGCDRFCNRCNRCIFLRLRLKPAWIKAVTGVTVVTAKRGMNANE